MITRDEYAAITEVLSGKYTGVIIAELDRLGIKNEKGKTFGPDSIVAIMRGVRENAEVEAAIVNLAAEVKARKVAEHERRKKLLRGTNKVTPPKRKDSAQTSLKLT